MVIGEDEFDVEEGELYAEQYLPADAYLFPTRVVFDSGEERRYQLYVRIPDEYWVQAGLADFYIGKTKSQVIRLHWRLMTNIKMISTTKVA